MKQNSKHLLALLAAVAVLCTLLLCACNDQKKTDSANDADETTGTSATSVTGDEASSDTQTTAPTTTGTTQKGYADGGVSVRDEPGLDGSNVDTLYEQEITIVDKVGDWYEIEYTDPYGDHKTGYVSGDVIEIEGNPNKSEMNASLPTTTTTTTVATTADPATTTTGGTGDGETSVTTLEGIPVTDIEDDPSWSV